MSYPHYSHACASFHDVVVDFDCSGPEETCRPEIVCLCGSTRFFDTFQEANYRLTMAGKIVLTVGFYANADPERWAIREHGELVGITPEQKIALDALHKRKIDLADRVIVLNVGGYVGESTHSEVAYARAHNKTVDYLYADTPPFDVRWRWVI